MTTTERVAALWALYEQMDELITADEIEVYPVLGRLWKTSAIHGTMAL